MLRKELGISSTSNTNLRKQKNSIICLTTSQNDDPWITKENIIILIFVNAYTSHGKSGLLMCIRLRRTTSWNTSDTSRDS